LKNASAERKQLQAERAQSLEDGIRKYNEQFDLNDRDDAEAMATAAAATRARAFVCSCHTRCVGTCVLEPPDGKRIRAQKIISDKVVLYFIIISIFIFTFLK
jgi:hypothetical protein